MDGILAVSFVAGEKSRIMTAVPKVILFIHLKICQLCWEQDAGAHSLRLNLAPARGR